MLVYLKLNGPNKAMTENQIFPNTEPEELLKTSSEMTRIYNKEDTEDIRIKFSEHNRIGKHGTIEVNPEDAWKIKQKLGLSEQEAVRLLLDTVSHEMAHWNYSDLDIKGKISSKFKRYEQIAGSIMNIVEDGYIDYKRRKKWKGQQKPFDYKTEALLPEKTYTGQIQNDAIVIALKTFRLGEKPEFIPNNGFLKDWADLCEEKYFETIKSDKQEDRTEIAEELIYTLIENIPEQELGKEVPEAVKKLIEDEDIDNLEPEKDYYPINEDDKEDKAVELSDPELEGQKGSEEEETGQSSVSREEDSEEEEEDSESTAGTGDESKKEEDSSNGEEGTVEEEKVEKVEITNKEPGGNGQKAEVKEIEKVEDLGNDSEDAAEAEVQYGTIEDTDDDSETKTVNVNKKEFDGFGKSSYNTSDFEKLETGGGINQTSVEVSQLSQTTIENSKNTAVELSEDVKDALEDMKDDKLRTETINNQKGSEMDIDRAVRYMSGDKTCTDIYERKLRPDMPDRTIGVVLDASGSMEKASRLPQALKTLGAIGEASEELNDEFVAVKSYTELDRANRTQECFTDVICDVNETFDLDMLDDIGTGLRDNIVNGIIKCRERMIKTGKNGEEIMFVLVDGTPNVTREGEPYNETDAYSTDDDKPMYYVKDWIIDDVKDVIRETREDYGIKILAVGVGDGITGENLNRVFGEGQWVKYETENLPRKILELYEKGKVMNNG